jgi:enoyl-CoA hydratase
VVSENALAGMPETGIGLFPDIGATYFLNQCPGELGMYLALTGERLKAADLLYTRLATHNAPGLRFAEIAPRLAQGEMPDAALAMIRDNAGYAPLAQHRAAIDRAFAGATVEAVFDALKREGDWGATIAAHLATLSPTSLKVTYRAMRQGKRLDFDACMRTEDRLASRLVESHDFGEGVRALLIDKDQKPRWHPADLHDIRDADIAGYFEPLGADELML